MKTSESVAKISPALLKAQKAITFVAKEASNPFFKSKYADLPAVIDAIKVHLNENGIVYLQSGSPSESGMLALTTRFQHESGEYFEDTAVMPLAKADPQGFGSAMTYARRYNLAAMAGLYQDDDDGNAASNPERPTLQQPRIKSHAPEPIEDNTDPFPEDLPKVPSGKTISKKQQALIFVKAKQANVPENILRAHLKSQHGVEHTADLLWQDMDPLLKWIDKFQDLDAQTAGN